MPRVPGSAVAPNVTVHRLPGLLHRTSAERTLGAAIPCRNSSSSGHGDRRASAEIPEGSVSIYPGSIRQQSPIPALLRARQHAHTWGPESYQLPPTCSASAATGLEGSRDYRLAPGRVVREAEAVPPVVAECSRDEIGHRVGEERESAQRPGRHRPPGPFQQLSQIVGAGDVAERAKRALTYALTTLKAHPLPTTTIGIFLPAVRVRKG